jgi:hypothetical protein
LTAAAPAEFESDVTLSARPLSPSFARLKSRIKSNQHAGPCYLERAREAGKENCHGRVRCEQPNCREDPIADHRYDERCRRYGAEETEPAKVLAIFQVEAQWNATSADMRPASHPDDQGSAERVTVNRAHADVQFVRVGSKVAILFVSVGVLDDRRFQPANCCMAGSGVPLRTPGKPGSSTSAMSASASAQDALSHC